MNLKMLPQEINPFAGERDLIVTLLETINGLYLSPSLSLHNKSYEGVGPACL